MSRGNYQICRDCKHYMAISYDGTEGECIGPNPFTGYEGHVSSDFGCVHWQSKDPDYKEAVSGGCKASD